MTLQKQKPKRPTATHRKRVGQHHQKGSHYLKTYWPYLPIFAILALGVIANNWLAHARHDVLGYATDMSVQELLTDTNAQRSNNGQSTLSLNSLLNQAAQNKANDMAARDYWSHNTPDGQTPWTFITATGYQYQTAGENLAYGFTTASDTLTGWMNSPEHRANILNSTYTQVGFGIINIPNYQSSGPETLVVAMYAQPAAPVAAPAATAPSQSAAPAPAPQPATQPAADTPLATNTPAAADPASQTATKGDTVVSTQKPTETIPTQRVARVQLLTAGNASWSLFVASMVGSLALIFFLIRHSFAWHKVLLRGERFVLHHPLLDFIAISLAVAGLVLSQTSGLIR